MITEEKTKREKTFANFGEYFFWAYANCQMLDYALSTGKKDMTVSVICCALKHTRLIVRDDGNRMTSMT